MISQQEKKKIHRLVRAEHLGLPPEYVIDKQFENPLIPKTEQDVDAPHLHLLRLLRKPQYFGFTCKHIFNIELAPFQLVILDELWHRKYPMLIAARGASKSFMLALYSMLKCLLHQGTKVVIVGAAFRQAKVIFEYCEQIWYNAPMLRDIVGVSGRNGPRRDIDRCSFIIGESIMIALPLGDGTKIRGQRANVIIADEFACLDANTLVETNHGLYRIKDCSSLAMQCLNKDGVYEQPESFVKTPKTDVYEIFTEYNYSFRCSDKHKVLTMQGWKLAKDLLKTDYLVFDNKYVFPTESKVDKNLAWLLGCLLSEGFVNDVRQISIHHTDRTFIDRVTNAFNKIIPNTNVPLEYHPPYIDSRGWDCKESWSVTVSNRSFRETLYNLGLEYCTALDKIIPHSILQSDRDTVIMFMSGLFEGDGSCFLWNDRDITNKLGVAYYTASLQLAREVQVVLRKLGYISSIQQRKSKISDNLQYIVRLNGRYAYDFAMELKIHKWMDNLSNCYEKDIVGDDVRVVWDKSRNKWKVDVTICGANKYVGRYVSYEEAIIAYNKHKPVLHIKVKSVSKLPCQDNLYDFYLPMTNSFYGNGFIQHNTIPKSIYEEVVSGFASVRASPIEAMRHAARIRVLKRLGKWTPEQEDKELRTNKGNQAIIAGTANYGFNHFAEYWKEYKGVIESRGDPKKLLEVFRGKIPPKFNWRNYSVIRIDVNLLPENFMDEEHVARAQVTTDTASYQIEYGAVFAGDSNGFYKRSLIETCVVRPDNLTHMLPGVQLFHGAIKGDFNRKYMFAIDPASESDNFSIVLLELHKNHRRIVYCWTTTRQKHIERIKQGLITEHNFYAYCARKIRDLMKIFPCIHIVMDAQGGGRQISEALHDSDKIEPEELPIWEVIDEKDPKWSDNQAGLHILELVEFSNAEWVSEANHGLKKDLQSKVLLFPYFDPISLYDANKEDKKLGRIVINKQGEEVTIADTLEDVVMEIEAIKEELTTIQHTQTAGTNRDHWDTPEIKQAGGKKGRLRKDRYSALLMANMAARELERTPAPVEYKATGGFAKGYVEEETSNFKDMPMWREAPDWFLNPPNSAESYQIGGQAVKRGRRELGVFGNR